MVNAHVAVHLHGTVVNAHVAFPIKIIWLIYIYFNIQYQNNTTISDNVSPHFICCSVKISWQMVTACMTMLVYSSKQTLCWHNMTFYVICLSCQSIHYITVIWIFEWFFNLEYYVIAFLRNRFLSGILYYVYPLINAAIKCRVGGGVVGRGVQEGTETEQMQTIFS